MISTAALLAGVFLYAPLQIFVSPDGSDENDGMSKTHPIATLHHLDDVLKSIRKTDEKSQIEVFVQGSINNRKTVEFGPEASNVTFTGPGTISGAYEFSNWTPATFNGHKVISTPVPSGMYFRELWEGPQMVRAPRPNLPENGTFHFTGYTDPAEAKEPFLNVHSLSAKFSPGDLKSSWSNQSDIEIEAYQGWLVGRQPLASVDEENSVVYFAKPTVARLSQAGSLHYADYKVENVPEALNRPGQWYLNRPTHTLYYYPRPDEDLIGFKAWAPALDVLVRVTGATNCNWEGMTFEVEEPSDAEHAKGNGLDAVDLPSAVQLWSCSNCSLEKCVFEHVGGYAIEISHGSSGTVVDHCLLTDLGAGGIQTRGQGSKTTVEDCSFSEGGQFYPVGCAVWIGNTPHNRIIHNRISNFPFIGLWIGSVSGYGPDKAIDNLVEANDISHIGDGLMSDLGGIYVQGECPDTVVRRNRIMHVRCNTYGGWGIYMDAGASHMMVEDNVVVDTDTGGIDIHWGRDDTIQNNIFAYARREGDLHMYPDSHGIGPLTFDHNIFVTEAGKAPFGTSPFPTHLITMTDNFYWAGGVMEKLPLAETGSGLFIDPELGPEGLPSAKSGVYKFGFKSIDFSDLGPRL